MRDKLSEVIISYQEYVITLLPRLIIGLIVFFFFFLIGKIFKMLYLKMVRNKEVESIGREFIAKGILWIFISIGVIAFMHLIGLGALVNSVLAGAGISAIIIGFAFKDIAENLLSGVMLAVQRPFKIGNIIEVSNFKGTVKGLDLRNTHLRNAQGKDFYIPNALILKNVLTNYTKDGLLRLEFKLGVDVETEVPRLREIIIDYLNSQPEVLTKPAPSVIVEEIGVSSMDVKILFWINVLKTTESPGLLGESTRGRILREIKDLILKHNFILPAHIIEHKMYKENNPLMLQLFKS